MDHAHVEKGQADGAEKEFVLLSRRMTDPEEDISGFRQWYYCKTCHDYFVLAWHSNSSPLVEHCDVIPDTHSCLRGTDSAHTTVFCPRCQSDYVIYGPIERPETLLDRPDYAHVYEA